MLFGDQDVIDALTKMVQENSEWAKKKIYDITREVFDLEEVAIQPTERGAEISVSSADEDFQKKEFGADDFPPAHRLLKWKEQLDKVIK